MTVTTTNLVTLTIDGVSVSVPKGTLVIRAAEKIGIQIPRFCDHPLLESYEAARARGATILGIVAGCGELADSFHRTRSSPDGKPIIGCIRNALSDAGLDAGQIDYINAHGTGTPENDKMEYLCISTVFGERASRIPVSSNKSMVGHTLSAAGAVEAIFSLLTLEHQRIPPTINYDVPDPAIPFDVVPNKARDARVTAVMSNSFGFGGQNAVLVLTREPI